MKDKDLMRGFKWSMVVHGTFVLLLALNGFRLPGRQDQAEEEKESFVQVEIIDPPKKEENVSKHDLQDDGLNVAPAHASDDCTDFFGGIGITESQGLRSATDRTVIVWVSEVHKGYPAEAAGIQVYDQILNNDEIRGKIGTKVIVRILRDGQPLDFEIIRDKICTTPPKHKGEGL